jgi:RNA polymerase sigma-70 factor (ECF subfamily)
VESLDEEARAEMDAVLAQSEADRARLEQLRGESAAFLIQHPPKSLMERFNANPAKTPRIDFFPRDARKNEVLRPVLVPSRFEKDLGRQAVARDQSRGLSLENLYRQFGPVIHGKVLQLLKDKEEAWDVTQETFVVFVTRFERLENESKAFALLYQIATNLAVHRLRQKTRGRGAKPLAQFFDAVAGKTGASDGGVSRIEAAMELALLTDGESEQATTIAFLHFVDGHTVSEVGDMLRLSRRTVSGLLNRFIARARKRKLSASEDGKTGT